MTATPRNRRADEHALTPHEAARLARQQAADELRVDADAHRRVATRYPGTARAAELLLRAETLDAAADRIARAQTTRSTAA